MKFFRPTTDGALKGLSKALTKLRSAAQDADRRATAADRLVDKYITMSASEIAERNRANRVADKLEDLLA